LVAWLLGCLVAWLLGCLVEALTRACSPDAHWFALALLVVRAFVRLAFNAVNIGLFLWQVPTGLDIVAKVFQFTTLP
jgi:hypothetical protein